MARGTLLPGMGGRVVLSATVIGADTAVYTDEIDTSLCARAGAQVTSNASITTLTITPQQSFDGTNWADYNSSQVSVLGDIIRFDVTGGPIGLLRFKLSSSGAAATDIVTLTVAGFPVQGSF